LIILVVGLIVVVILYGKSRRVGDVWNLKYILYY
jgi:hypothetical protein